MLLRHLLIFFSKKIFRSAIRVSNSMDPGQARQKVGPDLGPICLQGLLTEDTCRLYQCLVVTCWERANLLVLVCGVLL